MATKEVEEVRRVNRLIRQFEVVFKSTSDGYQRDRVRKELKQLKDYRRQYLALHDIDQAELKESSSPTDGLDGFPILRDLVREEVPPREKYDEIDHLQLYMDCYYDEFMIFLTPKKLRLDVKFSLERDKFYPEYHELVRQVHDYLKTVDTSAELVKKADFRSDIATDVKSRVRKVRTNLLIKSARYFLRVRNFAAELVEDLEEDGGICKNGEEVLEFQELKGIRYLGGLTTWHALLLLLALGREVVAYLNVPDAALE